MFVNMVAVKCILYPYEDETRDIQSNITLCLKEFPRERARVIFDLISRVET